MFLDKKIDDITAEDMLRLKGNGESNTLEFKSELNVRSDNEKREFLYDISSFANSNGGCIIYGVNEQKGIAESFPGIDFNFDKDWLTIEQLLYSSVQPRISGVQPKEIKLKSGKKILIIEIPSSWNGPHRVTHGGANRFWVREKNARYQPDVEQLRHLFVGSSELGQKIRDFQDTRISKILGQNTPIIIDGPVMAIHLIPYSAYKSINKLSIKELRSCEIKLAPIGSLAWDTRVNLDGLLLFPNNQLPGNTKRTYTQVWRSGVIEAVVKLLPDNNICKPKNLEEHVCQLARYINALKELGLSSPVVVFITLVNVKGLRMDIPNSTYFDRDIIKTTEVIIEDIAVIDTKPLTEFLSPIFEEIANATGCDDWQKPIR